MADSLGRSSQLRGVIAAPGPGFDATVARAGPAHTLRDAGQPELSVRQDFGHRDAVPVEPDASLVRRGLQEVREALAACSESNMITARP